MKATRRDPEPSSKDTTDQEQNFARDFGMANKRIGATPQDRLRWLLNFAYIDTLNATRGQLLDAALELWAFLRYHQVHWEYTPSQPPEDMVSHFNARLRDGLSNLDRGKPWTLRVRDAHFSILWLPGRRLTLARTFPGPPEDHFTIAVFDLLREHGHKVRSCPRPGCKRLFLPIRRQISCSRACNQWLRTQRYRKTHAESISDKRHEAYKAKVRARHPRAKVARRPRRKP
jgi:hypothetical protein